MSGITLDGIVITGLVKVDDFSIPINGVVDDADDGSLILYEREILYSPITLVGGPDWGWLTRTVMLALKAAASIIGGTYVLDYEGVTSTVRFRTEDIPAMAGESVLTRSDQTADDYYKNITLKLMEV
jgi:hypothetical protein